MPVRPLLVLSRTAAVVACLCGLTILAGCNSPSKPAHTPLSTEAIHRPSTVYVADFYLSPEQIQSEHIVERPRPLRSMMDEVRGEDPASRAKRLIRMLSESIVAELQLSGVNAEYLAGQQTGFRQQMIPPDADLPNQGWIVSGWFEKADEGNRAMEATVGFGTGAENVGIEVLVSDLAGNVRAPFLFIGSNSDERHLPGGVVTLNPYVMAAKFVLSREDMERDVKTQGQMIARKLIAYMNTGATPQDPKPKK